MGREPIGVSDEHRYKRKESQQLWAEDDGRSAARYVGIGG